MKNYALFNIGLTLFLIFNQIINTSAFTQEDSIKPLVKINKEFLIVAHIVLDASKNENVSRQDIINTIAQVNAIFKPIGASFKICEFKTIENFNYNNLTTGKVDKNDLDPLYSLTHRINMYFIDIPDPIACGYASLGGIAEYGNVVIKKSCIDAGTIAHELGHFFGLKHTFENTVPELADGSNCKTAGDGFCDTPADPYKQGDALSQYINILTCKFVSELKDTNGEFYNPDVSNIMSYYGRCICLTFTTEQYNSMANYYLSHLGTW